MKLPQLLSNTNMDIENRKRALQRREMGQAYRKNAQYQAPKNPLLEALENLLSGKTERDLHTSEQEKREMDALLGQQPLWEEEQFENAQENVLNPLELPEHEVPQAAGGTVKLRGGQEDTAWLSVPMTDEKAADFATEEKIEIPERFMGSFAMRNAFDGSMLAGYQHLFQRASANYSQHIAMVKNGYRSFDEPVFSKTA